MRKGYKHFTELERERLYELLAAGKTKDQIAESLNKDRSSIYRELKRNKSRLGYLPDKANQYYHSRRQGSPKLEGIIKSEVRQTHPSGLQPSF